MNKSPTTITLKAKNKTYISLRIIALGNYKKFIKIKIFFFIYFSIIFITLCMMDK